MRPGLIAILVLCVSAISAVAADDRADERRRMVETIEAHAGSPEGGLAGGHIVGGYARGSAPRVRAGRGLGPSLR
jgi:hypothetical protein